MDRKKHYQQQTNLGALFMFSGALAGVMYDKLTGQPSGHGASVIASLMIGVGAIGWIYALSCYAMSKGRAWQWGLLGLTSWPGLLVLLMLSEKQPSQDSGSQSHAP